MKSAKEILEKMGFNREAPSSTQEAFFKHLISAAKETEKASVLEPEFKKETSKDLLKPATYEQLAFDFANNKEDSKQKPTG